MRFAIKFLLCLVICYSLFVGTYSDEVETKKQRRRDKKVKDLRDNIEAINELTSRPDVTPVLSADGEILLLLTSDLVLHITLLFVLESNALAFAMRDTL